MPVRAPASHLELSVTTFQCYYVATLFTFKHLESVHLKSKWLPNLQLGYLNC